MDALHICDESKHSILFVPGAYIDTPTN